MATQIQNGDFNRQVVHRWQMTVGSCQLAGGRWLVAADSWQLTGGIWQLEGGRWKVFQWIWAYVPQLKKERKSWRRRRTRRRRRTLCIDCLERIDDGNCLGPGDTRNIAQQMLQVIFITFHLLNDDIDNSDIYWWQNLNTNLPSSEMMTYLVKLRAAQGVGAISEPWSGSKNLKVCNWMQSGSGRIQNTSCTSPNLSDLDIHHLEWRVCGAHPPPHPITFLAL